MNREESYRILRICYKLFDTSRDTLDICNSAARDLYDLVELFTEDPTLRYHMRQAREVYNKPDPNRDPRIKCIHYLEHRLNIGIFNAIS